MDEPKKEPRRRGGFRWIAGKVVAYVGLILSLLVFPTALPWMILFWLIAAAVRMLGGRPAWGPLAVCVGIVLVKRVDWAPGLIVLGFVMIGVGTCDLLLRRRKALPAKRFAAIALPLLAVAWIGMAWNWRAVEHTTRRPSLLPDRPIVCVGDSLTVFGYPLVLREQVRIPVLDRSTGGINSEQGLQKIPEILERNPQVVVIELGGQDFFQKRDRAETKKNLERLILESRAIGAEVILFEIPRGFVTDPYAGLDRELAREHDLELITDSAIRNLVIWSPVNPTGELFRKKLSYDGLHPNERGHRYLADRVMEALVRLYGREILKVRITPSSSRSGSRRGSGRSGRPPCRGLRACIGCSTGRCRGTSLRAGRACASRRRDPVPGDRNCRGVPRD